MPGSRPAYALQTIKEIPYVRWREYDPEDAVRFYALRLREAGMIKSSPEQDLSEMALHVLAYDLTRVMNIMGIQPLVAVMRA